MNVLMTEELYGLYTTGASRTYKDVARNKTLYNGFVRAVKTMETIERTDDLKAFSYLHYEKLKYQFSGYSSVRLANGYVHRLLFNEKEDGIEVELINIDDTHYGNK